MGFTAQKKRANEYNSSFARLGACLYVGNGQKKTPKPLQRFGGKLRLLMKKLACPSRVRLHVHTCFSLIVILIIIHAVVAMPTMSSTHSTVLRSRGTSFTTGYGTGMLSVRLWYMVSVRVRST